VTNRFSIRKILLSYAVWLTITRTLKLLPHLWKRPRDVIYVPAFIAFGYYFAVMKMYALFTLHEVGWGTRAGIGDASVALKALDNQNEAAAQEKTAADARRYDPEAAQYAAVGSGR